MYTLFKGTAPVVNEAKAIQKADKKEPDTISQPTEKKKVELKPSYYTSKIRQIIVELNTNKNLSASMREQKITDLTQLVGSFEKAGGNLNETFPASSNLNALLNEKRIIPTEIFQPKASGMR